MNSESPRSKISKQFSKWALLDKTKNKTYLLKKENLIGRLKHNDIKLQYNKMCSRIHAFITINNDSIIYKDISSNGSLIKITNEFNQIKKSETPIHENTIIKIGTSLLKLININKIESININDDNTETETNTNNENDIIQNDDEETNDTNKNTDNTVINNDNEYKNNDENNKTKNEILNENVKTKENRKNNNINKDNKKHKISKTKNKGKYEERLKRINLIIANINNKIIELNTQENKNESNKDITNDNIKNNENEINMIDHTIENII